MCSEHGRERRQRRRRDQKWIKHFSVLLNNSSSYLAHPNVTTGLSRIHLPVEMRHIVADGLFVSLLIRG